MCICALPCLLPFRGITAWYIDLSIYKAGIPLNGGSQDKEHMHIHIHSSHLAHIKGKHTLPKHCTSGQSRKWGRGWGRIHNRVLRFTPATSHSTYALFLPAPNMITPDGREPPPGIVYK